MKKVKIHYKKSAFKGYSGLCESVFCAPFEDPEKFKEDAFENGRFDKLVKEGSNYLEFTSIEDCDYVIIPYKWDDRKGMSLNIIAEAKLANKKIIALYNDDYLPTEYGREYPTLEDGYIFSSNIIKFRKKENEFIMPAFTGDFFEGEYVSNRNLGFCGAITHPVRNYALGNVFPLVKSLTTNFIIRKRFWAEGEMTKDEARIGYLENMKNNTFILCMRGAGNFSYRLYETMMMGRIPVIIDSDQVFPFEDILNYSEFSIRISEEFLLPIGSNSYPNYKGVDDIINVWLENKTDEDIIKIQKKNREIWEEYMSPLGWIKNFEKEICHSVVGV